MRCLLLCSLMLAVTGLVLAQSMDQDAERRSHGYVFAAPGGLSDGGRTTGTLHFGGGGEGIVYKGLGVGGEIGYLGPIEALNSGIGVLSLNGSYHFRPASPSRKVVPFLTGGYSLGFRGGAGHGMNLGGGVNYWFRERTGLRLEFRDHFVPGYSDAHLWQVRLGLSLR